MALYTTFRYRSASASRSSRGSICWSRTICMSMCIRQGRYHLPPAHGQATEAVTLIGEIFTNLLRHASPDSAPMLTISYDDDNMSLMQTNALTHQEHAQTRHRPAIA